MGTLITYEKFDIHQKILLLSQLSKELRRIYENSRKIISQVMLSQLLRIFQSSLNMI